MRGKSFEEEVRKEITKILQGKSLLYSKPISGLIGLSGNDWISDIVVERVEELETKMINGFPVTTINLKGVRAVIECKDTTTSKQAVFRNQMLKAYGQLGDLRNLKCP